MFDSDCTIPSGETKRVLTPQNVDSSHFSGGQIRWPFSLAPPSAVISSPSSPSAESSFSHGSSHRQRTDLKFQLIVTIYRRAFFTRNVGFVLSILIYECLFTVNFGFGLAFRVMQQICYVPLPSSSIPSCSSPVSDEYPHDLPRIPLSRLREHPSVFVRGRLFDQDITVECKVSDRSRILLARQLIPFLVHYPRM